MICSRNGPFCWYQPAGARWPTVSLRKYGSRVTMAAPMTGPIAAAAPPTNTITTSCNVRFRSNAV